MLQHSAELGEAVSLINRLDDTKFQRLLQRIIDRAAERDAVVFTADEEDKLQSVLALNATQIQLVVRALQSLVSQMIYHLTKPKSLAQELAQLNLDENKVVIFLESWAKSCSKIFERLKDSSTTKIAPKELDDVNCKLKLGTNNNSSSQLKDATVQLDLVLTGASADNNLSLEMNHQELAQFYNHLEAIQTKLDALQKS